MGESALQIRHVMFHDSRLGEVRLDPLARRLSLRLESLRPRVKGPDRYAGAPFDGRMEFHGVERVSGLFDLPSLDLHRAAGNVTDLVASGRGRRQADLATGAIFVEATEAALIPDAAED